MTAELQRILDQIRILSPTEFTFRGRPAVPFDPAHNDPVTVLQHHLYQYCFSNRLEDGAPEAPPVVGGAGDSLVEELSAANAGQDRWDPGWQIVTLAPTGQVWARKGDRLRSFWPGEFITVEGPGMPPRVGALLRAFFPRESRNVQAGFYFAFGNSAEEEPDDFRIARFYWAVNSNGAPRLVRLLTERLNRFEVPFRAKALVQRSFYKRLDAALLYVNKRYYQMAARVAEEVHAEMHSDLAPGTPLFTKRLAPGLALAEDPGTGESFGMHRCRILAEGVWGAFVNGVPDVLAEVERRFAAYGISLDRPHLNAGSVDQYEYPV